MFLTKWSCQGRELSPFQNYHVVVHASFLDQLSVNFLQYSPSQLGANSLYYIHVKQLQCLIRTVGYPGSSWSFPHQSLQTSSCTLFSYSTTVSGSRLLLSEKTRLREGGRRGYYAPCLEVSCLNSLNCSLLATTMDFCRILKSSRFVQICMTSPSTI